MNNDKHPVYIKKATVEGYRSLRYADLEFKRGLNLIIGTNGSGKTNLLRILSPFVRGIFDSEARFAKCTVDLEGKHVYSIIMDSVANGSLESKNLAEEQQQPGLKLLIDGQVVIDPLLGLDWFELMHEVEDREDIIVVEHFIEHGLPRVLGLWSAPMNSTVPLKEKGLISPLELSRLIAFGTKDFLGTSFLNYFRASLRRDRNVLKVGEFDAFVKKKSEDLAAVLREMLKKYSPVTDIRLYPDTIFSYSEESNEYSIRNLIFEFYSEGSWKTFEQLSDGSKRIVHILSELANYYGTERSMVSFNEIIFIEEPELGIHPHLLYQLMLFLKEEALTKQVIITTHSPLVLDILDRDELDRINICYHDSEKGTLLRHLSKEEIEKAIGYMDEVGYLSQYWLRSDLENTSK